MYCELPAYSEEKVEDSEICTFLLIPTSSFFGEFLKLLILNPAKFSLKTSPKATEQISHSYPHLFQHTPQTICKTGANLREILIYGGLTLPSSGGGGGAGGSSLGGGGGGKPFGGSDGGGGGTV